MRQARHAYLKDAVSGAKTSDRANAGNDLLDSGSNIAGIPGPSLETQMDPIIPEQDLTIPQGAVWEFDTAGIMLQGNNPDGVSVYNYGQIVVTGSDDAFGIRGFYTTLFTGKVIENHGLIKVTGGFNDTLSTPEPWVDGITVAGEADFLPAVWNTSTGQIVVSGYYAHGIYSDDPMQPIRNDGLIQVTGNANAMGLLLLNGGWNITNSGRIVVQSADGSGASGIHISYGNNTIVNSGTIAVSATTNNDQTYGIVWGDSPSGQIITNSGTITAGHALFGEADTGTTLITNSGTINGAVSPGWGNDTLINSGHINGSVDLSNGDDVYRSQHGVVTGLVDGGAGNDTVTVDRSDATSNLSFTVGATNAPMTLPDGTQAVNFENFGLIGGSGNDTFTGGAGDDFFEGNGGNDTFNGGAGNDTMSYADATAGVAVDLSIAGAQAVGGGQGSDTLVSVENLVGSAFDDHLTGNAGNNVITPGAGNDIVSAGGGDDTIDMGANFSGGDAIDGGAGNDTLILKGDYSAGVTLTASQLAGVETIALQGQDDQNYVYRFVTADNLLSAGQSLSVDAGDNGYVFGLNFDGSAETNGSFNILGGAGSNDIIGGAGNDVLNGGAGRHNVIDASHGGDDTITAGYGDDTVYMGAALTAADTITGTTTDTVVLNGDYSAGVVFGAATMTNIGTISLTGGHSYKLTVNDATANPNYLGALKVVVDGTGLGASDVLDFDGSAETAAGYSIEGGAGNDIMQGGLGADAFVGGAGNDTVSYSHASAAVTASLAIAGTQSVGGGSSFDLDSFSSIENLTGSAFADTLTGDGGHNVLSGGAGNDVLNGGAGNDTIDGGSGIDTAVFSGNRSAYTVTRSGLTTTVTGPDGTDALTSIEFLQFGDVKVSMPSAPADANGDGFSDIYWQNASGQAAIWTINGLSQTGGATVGGNPGPSWHMKASGDFNGDGKTDILWQNDSGQAAIWTMDGLTQTGGATVGGNPGPSWHVVAAADFNGDGKADILWQNDNGQAAIWTMDGLTQIGGATVGGNPGSSWHIKAAADFNGDGKADILWQNDNGQAAIWLMDGLNQIGGATVGGNPGPAWHVVGAGDFNGDGKADILWQNDSGQVAIWTMDGLNQIGGATVGGNPGPTWHVKGAGDYNGDGYADILWQNDSGQAAIWTMNGFTQLGGAQVGGTPGSSWHVVGQAG